MVLRLVVLILILVFVLFLSLKSKGFIQKTLGAIPQAKLKAIGRAAPKGRANLCFLQQRQRV